jgi:tungstate transport system permease protein
MQEFGRAFVLARRLVPDAKWEPDGSHRLFLRASLTAATVSCASFLPLGAMLAMNRFNGRGAVIIISNALMGLPPGCHGTVHLSAAVECGNAGLVAAIGIRRQQ